MYLQRSRSSLPSNSHSHTAMINWGFPKTVSARAAADLEKCKGSKSSRKWVQNSKCIANIHLFLSHPGPDCQSASKETRVVNCLRLATVVLWIAHEIQNEHNVKMHFSRSCLANSSLGSPVAPNCWAWRRMSS